MGGFDGQDRARAQPSVGAAPAGPAIGTQPRVPAVPASVPIGQARAPGSREADDRAAFDAQAALKGPDVEIPALEGSLLSTRLEAVQRGLLSRASFDAGLALSSAMTQLQPAIAAHAPVDELQRQIAANAARQLHAAMAREAGGDEHFKSVPQLYETTGGMHTENPYTGAFRSTTYTLWMSHQRTTELFAAVPALILGNQWSEAFARTRDMLDGLDRWVADQLRTRGKQPGDAAKADAQQYHAALRTGLEQIADKHATRLPAVFHPDAKTVAQERAAGRAAPDAIPINVYFWKDPKDGKVHLYDLTTPGRAQEQAIDGPPNAAAMQGFFEDVARYPEGEVRYQLPDGGAGAAITTGKIKWYEWVGYAGMAIAAVGLAALTAGASVPATVCFAAGSVAGGVSAAGHLVDTERLGTASNASVVLDVAQIAASFASFGAMSLTIKAGSAAAALASSRWFIPLASGAAVADTVQLVALTDLAYVELSKVQRGPGSPEDKLRAAATLLTQLIVTLGLTALSIKGARDLRAMSGKQLEIIDLNGQKLLRVVGDGDASATSAAPHEPTGTAAAPAPAADAEAWVATLEASLDPVERAKLAKIKARKTPEQLRDMLGADVKVAKERVQAEVRAEQERAATVEKSQQRTAELERQISERRLMSEADIRELVDGVTPKTMQDRVSKLRDKLMSKLLHADAERAHPSGDVVSGAKIYELLPEATIEEWQAKHPGKGTGGLVRRQGRLYLNRGELDMMVIERQAQGKAKIIAREEIKTGKTDTNADARGQLVEQAELFSEAAGGKKVLLIELAGRDITPELDLASDAVSAKSTRGPAGKGFDQSLGVSAIDLEAMCKRLLSAALEKDKP